MKDPRDVEINEMLRRTSRKLCAKQGNNIISDCLDSLVESMEEMDKEENGTKIPQGS